MKTLKYKDSNGSFSSCSEIKTKDGEKFDKGTFFGVGGGFEIKNHRKDKDIYYFNTKSCDLICLCKEGNHA
jgi:hypothetical protein